MILEYDYVRVDGFQRSCKSWGECEWKKNRFCLSEISSYDRFRTTNYWIFKIGISTDVNDDLLRSGDFLLKCVVTKNMPEFLTKLVDSNCNLNLQDNRLTPQNVHDAEERTCHVRGRLASTTAAVTRSCTASASASLRLYTVVVMCQQLDYLLHK